MLQVGAGEHRHRSHYRERGLAVRRFIDWLFEANIFVIPLDDRGFWFRYHHLFQDFLRNQLRKHTGGSTVSGLHGRAIMRFVEDRLIDEAIRHALSAGDNDYAVWLV